MKKLRGREKAWRDGTRRGGTQDAVRGHADLSKRLNTYKSRRARATASVSALLFTVALNAEASKAKKWLPPPLTGEKKNKRGRPEAGLRQARRTEAVLMTVINMEDKVFGDMLTYVPMRRNATPRYSTRRGRNETEREFLSSTSALFMSHDKRQQNSGSARLAPARQEGKRIATEDGEKREGKKWEARKEIALLHDDKSSESGGQVGLDSSLLGTPKSARVGGAGTGTIMREKERGLGGTGTETLPLLACGETYWSPSLSHSCFANKKLSILEGLRPSFASGRSCQQSDRFPCHFSAQPPALRCDHVTWSTWGHTHSASFGPVRPVSAPLCPVRFTPGTTRSCRQKGMTRTVRIISTDVPSR